MDLQLKNKKAFVSGSTSGIGMAIAKKLLEEQAEVIISGSSQQSVDKAVARLKAEVPNAQLSGIPTNFTRAASVEELIAQLEDIDILVNNVGIYEPMEFTKITDSDWDRFFEVNLMSGIRLSRALFPKMLEKNWGRILFITSESASNIPQEMIHYGVSKTALHGLSRGLAKLTKDTQVTVNTIMPGPTATEGVKAHFEKMAQETAGYTSLNAARDWFERAMQRAIEGLGITPQHVLVDGNRAPGVTMSVDTVVKGDSRVASISAASIIARCLYPLCRCHC